MSVRHEIKSQLAKLLATEDLVVEHKKNASTKLETPLPKGAETKTQTTSTAASQSTKTSTQEEALRKGCFFL